MNIGEAGTESMWLALTDDRARSAGLLSQTSAVRTSQDRGMEKPMRSRRFGCFKRRS